jgi:hypothetical protein
VIPANTEISGPNVTPEELCGLKSSTGATSTGGAMISNTGNFKQDTITNAVNLMIVSNTKNPVMSSFMQGAATGFISSMFANNAEAQRQQLLMATEILRRKQEQEQQRRIAEQQRMDAMFARLNSALKLEGLPFNLSMKGMASSSPESLQLKGMGSSGPADLKLKIADSSPTSYGLKGLPGIYVGGPAGGDSTPSNSPPTASANAGTASSNPNLVSGPGTGTTGPGIPGLPGIYLDGVQPSRAPQLAEVAQTLNGPDRAAAQDVALRAAQQNPALSTPSEDPKTQNFQQANQEYQRALASGNTASQDYQTAETHVESDHSVIDVARAQLNSLKPSVEQQQAFNQMLSAANTDEQAATLARQNFDSTQVNLSVSRDRAAAALASLSPPSNPPLGAPTVGLNPNAVVASLKTPDQGGTPVPPPTPVSAPAPVLPAERQYRPSGNGLVGGTGWIVGYNVPNPTPDLVAKSRAMLAEQEKLAGHPYSDAIDFQRYNFVIGIAAYTDFGYDLLARVVSHDEFTEGRYSIENMPGYAALTGRSFHELACHSNGAMVCLAALERKDVKADNVVLYGPQITEKALEKWDGLARSGQVKSVTLVVNTGDPVPPLSLGFEDYVRSRVELRSESYQNKALLKAQDLMSAINETAPRLLVHLNDCTFSLSDPLHCHGMDTYRSEGAR